MVNDFKFFPQNNVVGQPAATTLLHLASPPAQDPWGAGVQVPAPASSSPAFNNTQANVVVNDPWRNNASPAHKNPPPLGAPDWGSSPPLAAAAPVSDPWGAPPPAPAPSVAPVDPWGGVAAPAPAPSSVPDPWGSTASAVAPALGPAKSDPWSMNGGGAAPDPDAEFDRLRANPMEGTVSAVNIDDSFFSAPAAAPPSYNNTFDLTGMDQALGSSSKKPEDFLGKNSKLVNLESLIGPTRETVGQPSMQGTNPFMMVLGATPPPPVAPGLQTPVNNPFQQQRVAAPTINQMRAQPVVDVNAGFGGGGMGMGMGGGVAMGGGTTLPPPLLPSGGGLPPAQQQAQTNPFLL